MTQQIIKPTNKSIIETYLNHYRHSIQSVRTRKASLNYFFGEKYFGYSGHVFDLNTQILIDYFDWLKNLDSVNITTRKNKWSILISFLKFTMEYYRDYNFIVIIPSKTVSWNGAVIKNGRVKTNKKIIASKEELKKILEYFKVSNFKHYLIFRVLIETGMRKGELMEAKVSELTLKERYLNTHKGKTGEKYYFFSEELSKYLELYLKERNTIKTNEPYLFFTKYLGKYTTSVFNKFLQGYEKTESNGKKRNYAGALKTLGIDKNITCHTFRRTVNDLRKDMGCPNEDRKILLGHKVNDVNIESYTSSDFKKLRTLFDKWNPYQDLVL